MKVTLWPHFFLRSEPPICTAHVPLLPEGFIGVHHPSPLFFSLPGQELQKHLFFSPISSFRHPCCHFLFLWGLWCGAGEEASAILSALTMCLGPFDISLLQGEGPASYPCPSMAPSSELRAWHLHSSLLFHAHYQQADICHFPA